MVLEEETTLEETVKPPKAQHFLNDFDNESEEINVDHETDEEIDVNLTFLKSIDPEDYCEITLDDAIKDKTHSLTTEWPNNIYREFMEIVTEYQLSNSCGDRLIKLFNSIKNVNKNLFPKTTKAERKFLDNSDFSYMRFKKVPVISFQDVDYEFYYQLIINEIKTLLLQSDINKRICFLISE